MFREIGSEFWDVPITDYTNELFPESTQWFISGRSALKSIIHELGGCKTVAMPSWCCESMIKPFVEAGKEVHFYPVYMQDGLCQNIGFECDVLVVMDYFGYTNSQVDLRSYNGVIIRDLTHSVFSHEYNDADYYFGSLRKWCGLWTGGFAWSNNNRKLVSTLSENRKYRDTRKDAMALKKKYISNQSKATSSNTQSKKYLKLFSDAESLLDGIGIEVADERDIELIPLLDIEYIKKRRRENARILMDAFRDWLVFPELKVSECPLFVPVVIPNGKRDELRKELIIQGIYCPIHWPVSSYHIINDVEKKIYNNELSLVCDQRYTIKEMNYMIACIKHCYNQL